MSSSRMLSVTGMHTGLGQEAMGADGLLAALASHDASAWQALFESYFDKMYRFAYIRTGDGSAAEEIAAEVFMAAAKGIGGYRDKGAPIAAWLYRIARNQTADYLERRRRRPIVALDAVEIVGGAWDATVEDAADVAAGLRSLTREQQEVLLLRFFSDCSLEETAAAMGKKVNAIKVLQHRALHAMKRYLTQGGKT